MVRSKTWNIIPGEGKNRSINHRDLISPDSLNISTTISMLKNMGMGAIGFSVGTSGEEYTVSDALLGVPFAVNTPTPPTITNGAGVTVTNSTELTNNLVSGRRVTLQAGATFSGFTINTTDQEFIIQSGVTVTGDIIFGASAQRIILRGDPFRAHTIQRVSPHSWTGGPTDIFVNGVNVPGAPSDNFWGGVTRLVVMNSYFRHLNDSITFGGGSHQDVIWANNAGITEGTSQTGYRWHNLRNYVFVDNLVRKINSTHNAYRLHATDRNAFNLYVCRNQIEGSRIRFNPDDGSLGSANGWQVQDIWYEDNDQYLTYDGSSGAQSNFIEVNQPDDLVRCNIRNNRFYHATLGLPNLIGAGAGILHDPINHPTWVVSGNTFPAMPGTIPTWEFRGPSPSWNLPASISVTQGSFVDIRQYAVNATGAVLNVTGLSGGLSYNAGLERIEATAQSTASVTATFTINGGVSTQRTVSATALGTGYNLAAAIALVPFTVNLPAEPVITSGPIVCTTAQQITDSLAVNGRHTVIQAGTYSLSGISFGGNDKLVVCQPGVIINTSGAISISGASRNRWEGGSINGNNIQYYMCSILSSNDIYLRGMTLRTSHPEGMGLSLSEGGTGVSRLVLEGLDLETPQNTVMTGTLTDWVIANSRINNVTTGANGWAVRVNTSGTRIVYIDSYFRAIQNAVIRSGFNTGAVYTDYYFARNQVENGGFTGWRTEDGITHNNIWFIDNLFHQIAPNGGGLVRLGGSTPGSATFTNLTATGNQGVGHSMTSIWFSDTTSNPLTITGGYTTPPVWVMQPLETEYTLANAIAGLPFGISTPTPPTTTGDIVEATPANITTVLANNNGRRIYLRADAGNYGTINIGGQDQEITLASGLVATGNIFFQTTARRIAVKAEQVRNCSLLGVQTPEAPSGPNELPEDILVDGIYASGAARNFTHGRRLAYINSDIRAATHPLGAFNANQNSYGGFYTDVLIANCNLESTGLFEVDNWAGRYHNIRNFVLVDNRMVRNGDVSEIKHTFRYHGGSGADCFNVCLRRNLIIGNVGQNFAIDSTGTADPPSDMIDGVWVENNEIYLDAYLSTPPTPGTYSGGFIQVSDRDFLINFHVRNNNAYGPIEYPVGDNMPREQISSGTGWVIEGNNISPYQSPPSWEHQ